MAASASASAGPGTPSIAAMNTAPCGLTNWGRSWTRKAARSRPIALALFVAISVVHRVASAQGGPPREDRLFREPDLVEIVKVDPGIHLDVRYAKLTTGSFCQPGRPRRKNKDATAIVAKKFSVNPI